MSNFTYAVVEKATGLTLEATTTREEARAVKREFETYNSGNQFQIVQFVKSKVVR
jgi:glycogen synthase